MLDEIKDLVKKVDSSATIILFGSSAKGNSNKHSDIDLLILIDKEKFTYLDEREIKNSLYDLEFQTGKIISPFVLSKKIGKMNIQKHLSIIMLCLRVFKYDRRYGGLDKL